MNNADKRIHPFKIRLTKREYFAGLAMQGLVTLLADDRFNKESHLVTETAVAYADLLLKELDK